MPKNFPKKYPNIFRCQRIDRRKKNDTKTFIEQIFEYILGGSGNDRMNIQIYLD